MFALNKLYFIEVIVNRRYDL